jgi:hypothetical protein
LHRWPDAAQARKIKESSVSEYTGTEKVRQITETIGRYRIEQRQERTEVEKNQEASW